MSESKHTPGPWVYPEDSTKAPDLAIFSSVKPKGATSEYGACVAHVMLADPVTGFLPKGQHIANARLIAAAPDLLQAAKSTLRALEAEFGFRMAEVNFSDLYAAVAKATASKLPTQEG